MIMLRYGVVWLGMVWENLVFIRGNMTGEMYENVLDENLFQSSKKLQLGSGIVFQHDSEPKHTVHIVK